MVRLGDKIRLGSKEVERLTIVTGFAPGNLRSLSDLDAYIARCKRHYWGVSEETRWLHWLIERERCRVLGLSRARSHEEAKG